MTKTMHIHLDINGAMQNAECLNGIITVDGKTLVDVGEIKEFLRGQQQLGRKVLPMGDCDNFDYQKGCLGHGTDPV